MISSLKKTTTRLGIASALLALPLVASANILTYSDLTLSEGSFWNGSSGAGSFTSGGSTYYNSYDTQYFSWSGFAYSNRTNTAAAGVGAQYTSVTGGGLSSTGVNAPGAIYAVGDYSAYNSQPSLLKLGAAAAASLDGLYVTNSLYAAKSMQNGDSFAKKFNAADKDWFMLTIEGLNAANQSTGSVDVYLADFRSENAAEHFILSDWLYVNLESLGIDTQYLSFTMSSSDVGEYGINTPTYFVIGGLAAVPEPSTVAAVLSLATLGVVLLRRNRKS